MITTLRQCLHFLDRAGRRRLTVLAVLVLASSILESVGIGALFPFIGMIADPTTIERSQMLRRLYVLVGAASPLAFLQWVGAAILGLILLKSAVAFLVTWMRSRLTYRHQAELSTRLLGAYVRAPWLWRLERNSGDLISNVRNYPDIAFGVTLNAFLELATELLTLAALVALLTAVAPLVMAVLAAASVVLVGGLFRLSSRRMTALGRDYGPLLAEEMRSAQQALGSAKEIRLLGREDFFIDAFSRSALARGNSQAVQEQMRWLPRQVLEVILAGGMVVAAMLLLMQRQPADSVVSTLGIFAAASFRLMPSFNRILTAINSIQYGTAMVAALHREAALLADLEAAAEQGGGTGAVLAQALTIEAVGFTYPGGAKPVLDGVSATIGRGQSVGLVGASGAGKSTLADIILGLLEPSAGRVLVDGIDIARCRRAWQDRIGYVPQSIYLTDDTLRRNVALGLAEEAIDSDRLRAALATAQLTGLVDSLPLGWDTPVGELGQRLSGGQRQRIGIARALYHDPDLIVMDEATSALDGETEKDISGAIEALRGHKTLLLIAHRLSTVRHCDAILFLKDGRLADSGSFDALVEANADFRRLVELADIR